MIPDPLLPFDESSGLSASRSLRVANPDPLDSVIGLPQSDSDASVYSTEANDGHDSDYHGQTLHATTCERRLGNLDLDPEDPGNSDAEVDFVIGTARLEQQDWACGSDFGSTESGWSSIPSSDEDSTLHPRVFNDPSLANRMEGIGLTSFALGVQEKLVSSDRSPIGRTDTKFNSIVEEEATPRLSYRGPTTVAPMPSVLQISGTGLISSSGGSSLRPARTVKGPRGSRMLPKPPSILMEASGSASVVSSSSSQYIDNTTPFSGVPSRSRTAPGCSRPLSLQAVGRVQSERNPSQSGVRGTVAAFEDRGKKAQRSGGSCT